MRTNQMLLATLVALAVATATEGASTPEEKCEADKLKASGKKAACLMTEEAKSVKNMQNDPFKCSDKFSAAFAKAETKAGPGVCPTEGDTADVEGRIDADFYALAGLLGTVRFAPHALTVDDLKTGLMWERKRYLDSIPDPNDPNDADNTYTWSSGSPYDPDGTVFTDFLAELNNCESTDGVTVTGGYAGYCDWRLPTIAELRTIPDATQGLCGGGSGACIDPAFGATAASFYWSSTTNATFPDIAWVVNFGNGFAGGGSKAITKYVRAVRGGS